MRLTRSGLQAAVGWGDPCHTSAWRGPYSMTGRTRIKTPNDKLTRHFRIHHKGILANQGGMGSSNKAVPASELAGGENQADLPLMAFGVLGKVTEAYPGNFCRGVWTGMRVAKLSVSANRRVIAEPSGTTSPPPRYDWSHSASHKSCAAVCERPRNSHSCGRQFPCRATRWRGVP